MLKKEDEFKNMLKSTKLTGLDANAVAEDGLVLVLKNKRVKQALCKRVEKAYHGLAKIETENPEFMDALSEYTAFVKAKDSYDRKTFESPARLVESLAKATGTIPIFFAGEEVRLFRAVEIRNEILMEGYFALVVRNVGEISIIVEGIYEAPEFQCPSAKLTLGTRLSTSIEFTFWTEFRRMHFYDVSICTRRMPQIVYYILKDRCHLSETIAKELAKKLMMFGTRYFNNEMAKQWISSASSIAECLTPYYICYSGDELHAIATTAYNMAKNYIESSEVDAFDFNSFKNVLEKEAMSRPGLVPMDIVFYGRKIYGCGLVEGDCSLKMMSITPIRHM